MDSVPAMAKAVPTIELVWLPKPAVALAAQIDAASEKPWSAERLEDAMASDSMIVGLLRQHGSRSSSRGLVILDTAMSREENYVRALVTIHRFFIHPDFRRLGHGSHMLQVTHTQILHRIWNVCPEYRKIRLSWTAKISLDEHHVASLFARHGYHAHLQPDSDQLQLAQTHWYTR